MRSRAYLLLFLSMLSWGVANPFSDIAVDQMSVGLMFVIEVGAGALILTIIGLMRRTLSFAMWKWALVLGLLEPGLTYLFGNLGYASGTVSTGLIVMQSEVLFLAYFGWLFLRERISRKELIALIAGSVGAITVGWAAVHDGVGSVFSSVAFAIAALAAAGYAISARRIGVNNPNVNVFALTWLQSVVSLLFALLVYPFTSQLGNHQLTPDALHYVAAVAAGVFGVAIPFILFIEAAKVVPARHSALALNVIPVAGIAIGAFLGRGFPTTLQYVGGAVVLLSLFAIQRQSD